MIPAAAGWWGSPEGGWSRASEKSDKSSREDGDAVAMDGVGACAAVPCLGGVEGGKGEEEGISERAVK